MNFCSLVTCAPKESHNVKGVAALPFFGFPPLCYSRRMKAWLPFSGFRPLFYAFSILSPFVILGVFSSPLLFLEDKDCLPFFIGLRSSFFFFKEVHVICRKLFSGHQQVAAAMTRNMKDGAVKKRTALGSLATSTPTWLFGQLSLPSLSTFISRVL